MKPKGTQMATPHRVAIFFMATPAQIAANRLNATKSTGPRSVEGKSVSRFNSTKSGIYAKALVLPGEDPAELEALVEACRLTHQPVGQDETELVDQLIESSWQQRRLARLETEVLTGLMSHSNVPPDCRFVHALQYDYEHAKMIPVIWREKRAAVRAWHKAFSTLRQLQEARRREADAPHDPIDPPPASKLASFPQTADSANQLRKIGPVAAVPAPIQPGKEVIDDCTLRL